MEPEGTAVDKHVSAAKDTHATISEVLETAFSMRSVSSITVLVGACSNLSVSA